MVQDILDTEAAAEREELLPDFLLRRISPAQAGEAVAEAVLRRRARVIAPRYWTALSVLRGVINPAFDLLSARQQRVQDAIREAEVAAAESPASGPNTAATDS
jgi:hypothetical protein